MISILVKDLNGNVRYNTTSNDEKLEKFIKENPKEKELIIKKLCKEFEIRKENIHSFKIVD